MALPLASSPHAGHRLAFVLAFVLVVIAALVAIYWGMAASSRRRMGAPW
jgi:hypothetical protein